MTKRSYRFIIFQNSSSQLATLLSQKHLIKCLQNTLTGYFGGPLDVNGILLD